MLAAGKHCTSLRTFMSTRPENHQSQADTTGASLSWKLRQPVPCRRGVATYKDVYRLSYVRGPSGIIVMLAKELRKN